MKRLFVSLKVTQRAPWALAVTATTKQRSGKKYKTCQRTGDATTAEPRRNPSRRRHGQHAAARARASWPRPAWPEPPAAPLFDELLYVERLTSYVWNVVLSVDSNLACPLLAPTNATPDVSKHQRAHQGSKRLVCDEKTVYICKYLLWSSSSFVACLHVDCARRRYAKT